MESSVVRDTARRPDFKSSSIELVLMYFANLISIAERLYTTDEWLAIQNCLRSEYPNAFTAEFCNDTKRQAPSREKLLTYIGDLLIELDEVIAERVDAPDFVKNKVNIMAGQIRTNRDSGRQPAEFLSYLHQESKYLDTDDTGNEINDLGLLTRRCLDLQ